MTIFKYGVVFMQGVNSALFWDKVNFKEYVPLVPTSAISGDGMGDLIALLVTYSQRILISSLMFSEELECIVLEVCIQCSECLYVLFRKKSLNRFLNYAPHLLYMHTIINTYTQYNKYYA